MTSSSVEGLYMAETFYEKTGQLISPGDLFDPLPYTRVPKPLRVARKVARTLPRSFAIQGELREILEVGKHHPDPEFNFEPPGEETVARSPMTRAIFLTWGSEVESDQREGKLHKKHWLVAPIFPMDGLEVETKDSRTGGTVDVAEVIRTGQTPRFFPLPPLPQEESKGFYVDFRKICPLAATYFEEHPRSWRLAPTALNDLYHHLMWFFTRRNIFFGPISCPHCHAPVDLGIVFEGQPINPEEPEPSP
jgi:hypothetical protein